jgi:transposase
MKDYIAFDCHKRYTLMERWNGTGLARQARIEHEPGSIRQALGRCRRGSEVAVEAMGSWYWIVSEIEEAGLVPRLVHPRKAKLMMGMINKTDKLDVHGLNRLQQNGTLPTVWIPPDALRDQRELARARMVLTHQRTQIKNRLLATLSKYGLEVQDASDAFGAKARPQWEPLIEKLPEQTGWTSRLLLRQVEFLDEQIRLHQQRVRDLVKQTPEMELLKTLPGIGEILSAVVTLEVGDVERFASAERLASYAGTTPRVHSSGDKTRYGRLRPDVNRFLKWALIEAANSVALNHRRLPDRHVSQLYIRLKQRRGHAKAVGAVARHLAEAVWHVLHGRVPYRDPALGRTRET